MQDSYLYYCLMNTSLSKGEFLNYYVSMPIKHILLTHWNHDCMLTLVTVELTPMWQHVELTCTTSASFIIWNFMLLNEWGLLRTYERLEDVSQQASIVTVNSTTFNFMRSSAQNSSPLMSSLLICVGNETDRHHSNLNGTVISCTGVDLMGSARISTSTTVYIIGSSGETAGFKWTHYHRDYIIWTNLQQATL